MSHVKSYDEMTPEQRFAYDAGKLAASQQIAEQQAELSRLRKREERLAQTIVEMAVPLEVLLADIPYIRQGPLAHKVKALSPQLEAEIAQAVKLARAALTDQSEGQ